MRHFVQKTELNILVNPEPQAARFQLENGTAATRFTMAIVGGNGFAMGWDNDIRARFPDWGTDAALARWPELRACLVVGQPVCGEVIARAPFGIWVDIGVGHPALLLVPEMASANVRPIRYEEYPELGAVIEARVISLSDRAQINLTQRPCLPRGLPKTLG